MTLNVLKADEAEVVATVSGPQRLVTHMRLGDLAPLYATSGGKILLAHMPEVERERYLERVSFERVTPRTIHGVAELRRHLAEVRDAGVAYSFEEFTPGIVGVACAVISANGTALGSLNVAMPAVRYGDAVGRQVAGLLRHASSELAKRCGP